MDGAGEKLMPVVQMKLKEMGKLTMREASTLTLFLLAILLCSTKSPDPRFGWAPLIQEEES